MLDVSESTEGRVVHLRREPYDVRIDRQSPWGNPFHLYIHGDREEVIEKYKHWVMRHPDAWWIRENLPELRGKTLGCWCAPQACHGDVLLALANRSVLHYGDEQTFLTIEDDND